MPTAYPTALVAQHQRRNIADAQIADLDPIQRQPCRSGLAIGGVNLVGKGQAGAGKSQPPRVLSLRVT